MTPAWMRRLEYLSYLLGIVAIVFGSQEFGWIWGIVIIAWFLFGRGLVSPIWPVPTLTQSIAIANREAARGLAEATSRDVRAAQQLHRAVIARLLKIQTDTDDASTSAQP